MPSIAGSSGSQPVQNQAKTQEQVKTTLDKAVDFAKEKTQKGTLVGDHYIAVGAGTLVGGTAAVAGVAKIADAVPAVEQALEFVFEKNGKLLLGAGALGTAYVLGEDAIQSFKEGSSVKAGFETLGAVTAGLGGVEAVGRQYNIPGAKRALSATADFVSDKAMGIGGGLAAAGGAAAIKKGVEEIADGNTLKGAAYAAGGAVGVLGGAELVGRQFNVPVLKSALTGPAKAIFTSKGGMVASGGAIGLTGVGTVADGVRRLTTGKGIVNDAIGVAEVAAGVTAATGGTTLVGMATGSEKLARALPESAEYIGAAAALGTSVAAAKFTYSSVKENGVTLLNTATGVGSALAGLGAVELVGEKLGVQVANQAFSKGWKPVVGVGLAAATYKFGKGAANELKEGNMMNAAGQAGLSFLSAAGSAATLGDALNIPILGDMGEKVFKVAGDVAEPVFEFAVEHPFVTLGAVAVAGAAGVYTYTKNKDAEEEAAKAVQPKASEEK